MKRASLSILLPVLAILLLAAGQAQAEKRIALVIGNSAYAFAPLSNPKNDALLMARTLRGLGFDVIETIDASQRDMKTSIKAFGRKLDAAGKEGVGLFYYAGHGVQVKGANYLIPTDAQIETEGDVDIDAINTQSILSMMEFSGARLNFVIMDACRNNPFKSSFRSGTRGLARMDAPTGSLIAYATAPGDVAADGTGKNSPYTAALSQMMNTPGLSVERMFREVRNSVRRATDFKQTPWETSSLTGGDFYFASGSEVSKTHTPSPGLVPMADKETVFWQSIQDSKNARDYQAYLDQFPGGTFDGLARSRLASLQMQPVETPPSAAHPYDGDWEGWLRTYGGLFGSPVEASFRTTVRNGQLQGTVDMYGETRLIKAKVSRDGNLIEGRLEGSMQGYDLHGTLQQGFGDGATFGWKLEYKMVRSPAVF